MSGNKGLMFNFDIFLSLVIIVALFSYTIYLPQKETASMSHIDLSVREQSAFYDSRVVSDVINQDSNYVCREFYIYRDYYRSNLDNPSSAKVCELII